MKKSSWIVLGLCLLLVIGLVSAYFLTQNSPATLNQAQAMQMIEKMQDALHHKNVNGIMDYISPNSDTRISNLNQEQLRRMLIHYMRSSDTLSAEVQNPTFTGGDSEAELQFDLTVFNNGQDSRKEDYKGHVILHLKRVEVSRLLGLYQTKEWRIVGAESTGPSLENFGDY